MAADANRWKQRIANSAILLLIVLAVFGLVYAFGLPTREAQPSVRIGGPFTLTTQAGDLLSDADLKGAPFTVFFGFTHCPGGVEDARA